MYSTHDQQEKEQKQRRLKAKHLENKLEENFKLDRLLYKEDIISTGKIEDRRRYEDKLKKLAIETISKVDPDTEFLLKIINEYEILPF